MTPGTDPQQIIDSHRRQIEQCRASNKQLIDANALLKLRAAKVIEIEENNTSDTRMVLEILYGDWDDTGLLVLDR